MLRLSSTSIYIHSIRRQKAQKTENRGISKMTQFRQINKKAYFIMNKAMQELYKISDLSTIEIVGLLAEYQKNELEQLQEDRENREI